MAIYRQYVIKNNVILTHYKDKLPYMFKWLTTMLKDKQ